jgi:hypothetical protein
LIGGEGRRIIYVGKSPLRELYRILSKDDILTTPEVLKAYICDGQTNRALSLEVVLLRRRSRQRTEGGVRLPSL